MALLGHMFQIVLVKQLLLHLWIVFVNHIHIERIDCLTLNQGWIINLIEYAVCNMAGNSCFKLSCPFDMIIIAGGSTADFVSLSRKYLFYCKIIPSGENLTFQ